MPLSEIKTLSGALELFDGISFDDNSVEEALVYVLEGAQKSGASDVIFLPGDEFTTLKYRTQGNLMTVKTLSVELYNNLLRIIKNLSDLNPNEHLKVQKGKGTVEIKESVVDIGVLITPIDEGEKCILGMSDSKIRKFDLENIGLERGDLKKIMNFCKEKNGLILIAGERDSGKTTTAYALVRYLISLDRRIVTVENPIFYTLLDIDQIENKEYEDTLEGVLEKDPDIVFVDKLETREAGELVSRAITSGLLVISTVSVKGPEEVSGKLKDLGMNDFLISKALKLVIFQNLLGVKCPRCGGDGCRACDRTGVTGRTGCFTILTAEELT